MFLSDWLLPFGLFEFRVHLVLGDNNEARVLAAVDARWSTNVFGSEKN